MLFVHQTSCISPQQTFGPVDIGQLTPSVDNRLHVQEPVYPDIPPGLLRRMGKSVKISVGTALPLIKGLSAPDGIIIGSGNGGLEDCIKFLDQIIQYEEGMLTPANFVQSTANAMASQISMLSHNHAYNITHVHRGLAFENALLDTMMQAAEDPTKIFLVGGVDEISEYNNNIETLSGSFKTEPLSNGSLYKSVSPGAMAGEGASMFRVSGTVTGASARVVALEALHTRDAEVVRSRLGAFLAEHLPEGPDLLLTGENGDVRLLSFYEAAESVVTPETTIGRFKHMSGESPTASAMGTWLACHIIQTGTLPEHMIKRSGIRTAYRNIVLYNNYKGLQHSFLYVSGIFTYF